jgi:hypothetical protein
VLDKGFALGHYPTRSQGEILLFWLAPDSAHDQAAPSLRTTLTQQLGENKCAEIMTGLETMRPASEIYEIQRLDNLSNLGH